MDANGRSVGDPYYDPSTETDPSQSAGSGNAYDPNAANGSISSLANPDTSGWPVYNPNPGGPGTPYVPPTPGQIVLPNTQGTPTSATVSSGTSGPPTGSFTDPNFVNQYIAYYAALPGADPSLSANPSYWAQKILSGEFGTDPSYIADKLQNSWKTPSGANAGTFNIDPSYLAPFTEQFKAPGDASNPASAFAALNPRAFTLPTESDLFASPGFQASQDAVRNAVVNSNASKGLINSGGSIYDLAHAAADLEGQQYNDLVNQQANAYGINAGQAQNAFNNAWQQWLGRQNLFFANQNQPFSKLSTLASLGLNAAGNAG